MRILLRLSYDGGAFRGCPVASGVPTVCGTLADALGKVSVAPSMVETLSRTDAGVHALANVGHALVDPPRAFRASPARLVRALNQQLPLTLRVLGVAVLDAPPVVGPKTYRYTVDASRWGDPHRTRDTWRLPGRPPTLEALVPLAAPLVGTRDWAPFRRAGETRQDLVRTLHRAAWTADGAILAFTVTGSGFPYRLVRALVGGMVIAARRGDGVRAWEDTLSRGGPLTRHTAPAHGLCLRHIEVPARFDPG